MATIPFELISQGNKLFFATAEKDPFSHKLNAITCCRLSPTGAFFPSALLALVLDCGTFLFKMLMKEVFLMAIWMQRVDLERPSKREAIVLQRSPKENAKGRQNGDICLRTSAVERDVLLLPTPWTMVLSLEKQLLVLPQQLYETNSFKAFRKYHLPKSRRKIAAV